MEKSFADLLSDAFSETAVPSFPDGDLDFENISFDERFEENKTDISHENVLAKEDEALQQEATGQTAFLSCVETKDVHMAEHVDEKQFDDKQFEEDFEGVGVKSRSKTPEEDYTSSESEQEGSASGEDEAGEEEDTGTGEKPGDLLRPVHCGDEFCDGNKEDRVFAEGQPLTPEAAENPQVRNEEQGESESDEEVSYFKRVPEHGSEMMIGGDGIEEDEQVRSEEKEEDSCEGMKIEHKEDVLCKDDPAKASLEFPEISEQNLQDLIAEVDREECREKVKDFSGEEHQDAGESFADYPSDFSSCEYVEDRGKSQESDNPSNAWACASDSGSISKPNTCLERDVVDVTCIGKAEDTDEEEYGYLYSRDLKDGDFRRLYMLTGEQEAEEIVLGDAAVAEVDDEDETSESDSYTSSDDEVQEKRSDEELFDSWRLRDLESNKQLWENRGGSSEAFSDDYYRGDSADFNIIRNLDMLTTHLSEDLLTTEDTNKAETPLSDETQHPAEEDVNSYSVVQRGDEKTTSHSNQGFLDDSFFFNTVPEASGITELGQWGEYEEYEEERNWEQEQERIKAFNKFYDDSDGENRREERQIKVQFCADPLSQVIHYETDSSERDSHSSSTEGEEDLSSADSSEVCLQTHELREPDDSTEMTPACDPPNAELPENVPDNSNTHICTRKDKCFNMLKLTLKMGLVILTGLLMFWFASDQAGWFSHVSFF